MEVIDRTKEKSNRILINITILYLINKKCNINSDTGIFYYCFPEKGSRSQGS